MNVFYSLIRPLYLSYVHLTGYELIHFGYLERTDLLTVFTDLDWDQVVSRSTLHFNCTEDIIVDNLSINQAISVIFNVCSFSDIES